MKHVLSMTLLVLFVVIAMGCGSSGPPQNINAPASDQVLRNQPDWYLDPPRRDNYLYGTGTSTSRDMQASRDRASQAARAMIAQTLETEFSSLTRRFQEEVGTELEAQYLDQFTQAMQDVTEQTLRGVTIKETEMLNEGGVFRCYVLVELDYAQVERMLAAQIRQNEQLLTRMRSTEVFQQLEAATGGD